MQRNQERERASPYEEIVRFLIRGAQSKISKCPYNNYSSSSSTDSNELSEARVYRALLPPFCDCKARQPLMEEEKAAAYYEELTRKGEGAARFKQGLGFTPQSSTIPTKGSAFPSSSSFLSSFVKASGESIPDKSTEIQKQSQLENIQNKLKKKQNSESRRRSTSRERDRSSRRRSRSRDGHDSRRRSRSLSRDRDRYRDRDRRIERRRRRSSSRSSSDEERRRRRSSRETHSRRRRSRSSSPRRNREKGRGDGSRNEGKKEKERNGGIDYSRLIKGYEEMTPAERVKAKMKLQLSQTVEKDSAKGMGAGWERFEFNKDAPLDDEEMEVVEDDKVLVKNIGQSFRFSAVEAKREEQIKAAHDAAMFGTPAAQSSSLLVEESIVENDSKENEESNLGSTLISEKVLEKQQGSWRDRARKLQDVSKS